MQTIDDTLRTVVRTGHAATLTFLLDGTPSVATVNPDGSVIADSILHIDRLTGRRMHER